MCDLCTRRGFMPDAGGNLVAIDAHKVVGEARVALAGVRDRAKWR